MTKKVFIGVGHGGRDPGAVANGLKESQVALDVGLRLNYLLKKAGVFTCISRTSDIDDDLSEKIARCNVFAPDLALDIHFNSGGGEGFEVYHYSGGGTSELLASNIEQEVKKFTKSRGLKVKLNDRGSDYFGFIRSVKAPSIIVEGAFLDNATDVERVKTDVGRQKFAEAYAFGILKTLGIDSKIITEEELPKEEPVQAVPCQCERIVYKKIEDVPQYGVATITKLLNKGYLQGDSNGELNISEDVLRMYVVNDRAGLYDK